MGKYTCDDRRMVNPRFNSIDRSTSLTFRVWGGMPWISVNGAKDGNKIYSKNIKYEEMIMIGQIMQEFLKAEPGKEQSFVYNAYNFKEKKRVMEFIFVLKKDEKSVYHIIIKANNQVFDFPVFFTSNSIAYGTGDMPEADRSRYAMKTLIHHILNVIPVECQMTSFPMEQRSGGGNNTYANRGGSNYGSQGDFKSSNRNLPSDDDIFSQE